MSEALKFFGGVALCLVVAWTLLISIGGKDEVLAPGVIRFSSGDAMIVIDANESKEEAQATLDQKYTGTYRNLLVQLGRLCCAKAMRDEEPEVEQPLPLSSSS